MFDSLYLKKKKKKIYLIFDMLIKSFNYVTELCYVRFVNFLKVTLTDTSLQRTVIDMSD
jgi:hypothetical protein